MIDLVAQGALVELDRFMIIHRPVWVQGLARNIKFGLMNHTA